MSLRSFRCSSILSLGIPLRIHSAAGVVQQRPWLAWVGGGCGEKLKEERCGGGVGEIKTVG